MWYSKSLENQYLKKNDIKVTKSRVFCGEVIYIIPFLSLQRIVAGSFVLETVGDLEFKLAFVVAGCLFSDLGLFQKKYK